MERIIKSVRLFASKCSKIKSKISYILQFSVGFVSIRFKIKPMGIHSSSKVVLPISFLRLPEGLLHVRIPYSARMIDKLTRLLGYIKQIGIKTSHYLTIIYQSQLLTSRTNCFNGRAGLLDNIAFGLYMQI